MKPRNVLTSLLLGILFFLGLPDFSGPASAGPPAPHQSLENRAGPCPDKWVAGKKYVHEVYSSFNPANKEENGTLEPDGSYLYASYDERFCADYDPELSAWEAVEIGGEKGWIYCACHLYESEKYVEFISLKEYMHKWRWQPM